MLLAANRCRENTKKESPIYLLLNTSPTVPRRVFSWEVQPGTAGALRSPDQCCCQEQNSLQTVQTPALPGLFWSVLSIWVQSMRYKVLHGFRQAAKPTFLEGKEVNLCVLRHLLAHQKGTHRTNWIFRLAYFFNTRPKQANRRLLN